MSSGKRKTKGGTMGTKVGGHTPTFKLKIDPDKPLEVMIDFQSRHQAKFRLFVHRGAKWVLVKDGSDDHTVPLEPMKDGDGLLCEFVFFDLAGETFKAVVFVKQDGVFVEDGTCPTPKPAAKSKNFTRVVGKMTE